MKILGASVRTTVFDATAHESLTAVGKLVALAAGSSPPPSAGQPRQWDCLVMIADDTGGQVIVRDACELEFLPAESSSDAAAEIATLREDLRILRLQKQELDDECAQLTAQLKATKRAGKGGGS
jgi:hypothetical protein